MAAKKRRRRWRAVLEAPTDWAAVYAERKAGIAVFKRPWSSSGASLRDTRSTRFCQRFAAEAIRDFAVAADRVPAPRGTRLMMESAHRPLKQLAFPLSSARHRGIAESATSHASLEANLTSSSTCYALPSKAAHGPHARTSEPSRGSPPRRSGTAQCDGGGSDLPRSRFDGVKLAPRECSHEGPTANVQTFAYLMNVWT